MYYICKGKYSKEINSLDTKNKEKLDHKKLRLSDYLYSPEEEQEEQEEKTITDPNAFNEKIIKEETGINIEIFKKHFNFQRPSDMLKSLYKANTSQNNELVNLINSGLKGLKEEIKKMSKE